MKKFIEVKKADGGRVILSIRHIVDIRPNPNDTIVITMDCFDHKKNSMILYTVAESYESILKRLGDEIL